MMKHRSTGSYKVLVGIAFLLTGTMTIGHASVDAETAETTFHFPVATGTEPSEPRSSDPQCAQIPLLMAEGSNSCEIISCGMALKDTCKITCPADKTPKCSCDCARSFGPICTDYKANCRCE